MGLAWLRFGDRHRHPLEALLDDLGGLDALDPQLRAQQDPVPQHGNGDAFDVIRRHIIAPAQRGTGAREFQQRQRGPGTGAELHTGMTSGRTDEIHDVAGDARIDVDPFDGLLHGHQLLGADDARQRDVLGPTSGPPDEDLALVLDAGIAHDDAP